MEIFWRVSALFFLSLAQQQQHQGGCSVLCFDVYNKATRGEPQAVCTTLGVARQGSQPRNSWTVNTAVTDTIEMHHYHAAKHGKSLNTALQLQSTNC